MKFELWSVWHILYLLSPFIIFCSVTLFTVFVAVFIGMYFIAKLIVKKIKSSS